MGTEPAADNERPMMSGHDDPVAFDAVRAVQFPDGRTLTVRPLQVTDLEALDGHYRGLPMDDLRYRFFAIFRPDRRFLEGRVQLMEGTGFVLVAVVTGAGERLVGEAEYILLPDGDADLASVSHRPGGVGWVPTFLTPFWR
jgi:hypothetical protein